MLNRERFTGAAEAGHNFISDQKNPVPMADFGDAGGITFRRSGGTESGADDGFENEGSGCLLRVSGEKGFKIIGARELALRKGPLERAVVAKARCDVAPLGEERLVRCATRHVAADGHGAESAAVVALAARHNARAIGLIFFEEILAGEFDGCFGGFRPAGSEIDSAVLEIGRSKSEEASGQFLGSGTMKLGSVGESELRGLRGHGGGDFGYTMPDVDDGSLAGGVEEFAAVLREEPAPFATDGDGKRFAKVARKKGGVAWHAGSLRDCSRPAQKGCECERGSVLGWRDFSQK